MLLVLTQRKVFTHLSLFLLTLLIDVFTKEGRLYLVLVSNECDLTDYFPVTTFRFQMNVIYTYYLPVITFQSHPMI